MDYETTKLSVVHVVENVMEIKTEADSNDITETVNPLHDKPCTGMCLGFYDAVFSTFICLFCLEFSSFSFCCSFYVQTL